jgi:ComF family protein
VSTARLVPLPACGDKSGVRLLSPLARLAALALPPRCPACGVVAEADHRFCGTCWAELRFLGPPWCATCHLPFEVDRGADAQCGACLADPPRHDGVRAAVAYGPIARAVALKLKYGGRMAYAETMARAMARLMPGEAELLVPVPLHRWRLWGRGFNQAALIAGALSRARGVPADPHLLRRVKATPVLRGLGAKGRAKAVRGAFALAPGAKARLKGRTIVLVDDVHTSGATADACTRVLKRSGAARVILLCWARVLEGGPD